MAFSTYRDLLAIDGCQIEGETLYVFPSFSDMPDVVHLYPFRAITNRAVIQESGLRSSRCPSRERVHVRRRPLGFLHLLQRLVEEVDFSAIWFLEDKVLPILSEDFTYRRAFFVRQGLG